MRSYQMRFSPSFPPVAGRTIEVRTILKIKPLSASGSDK